MKNILILTFFIALCSCSKEGQSIEWDSYATINGKKHYGEAYVGIFPDWISISIDFEQDEFQDGYRFRIKKAMKDLEVNVEYSLGDDDLTRSYFGSIPDHYNNVCFRLTHGMDAISGCHMVCTKCTRKSFFMITEFAADSSVISGTMDLSVLHELRITYQDKPRLRDYYRVKDVYFTAKPVFYK